MYTDRQSQIAHSGPAALAEKLTEALRETGDLGVANPDLTVQSVSDMSILLNFC